MEKILLSTTGNVTGNSESVDINRFPELLAVFMVESAGTLKIQGSLDGTTWVDLHTALTATGGLVITSFPRIRGVSSDVSGGAVEIKVRG